MKSNKLAELIDANLIQLKKKHQQLKKYNKLLINRYNHLVRKLKELTTIEKDLQEEIKSIST